MRNRGGTVSPGRFRVVGFVNNKDAVGKPEGHILCDFAFRKDNLIINSRIHIRIRELEPVRLIVRGQDDRLRIILFRLRRDRGCRDRKDQRHILLQEFFSQIRQHHISFSAAAPCHEKNRVNIRIQYIGKQVIRNLRLSLVAEVFHVVKLGHRRLQGRY